MSEDWFWESELRIVWNLIEEKKMLDEIKMKNQAIYIASYVWGKDPDKENDKEIIGIDKPADSASLAQFMM
jgi:hypothetical protein